MWEDCLSRLRPFYADFSDPDEEEEDEMSDEETTHQDEAIEVYNNPDAHLDE